MSQRWTAADIPAQQGRVAVVTGANTGIGFETAKALALRGATVVLAVRDVERGNAAADRIRQAATGRGRGRGDGEGDGAEAEVDVAVLQLDLASLASIRAAAGELRAEHPTIDLLINNAGVMYTPRRDTADGFELQLGTNHLGHFALTGLLLDRLLPVAGSRVVTVSSMAHRVRSTLDVDDLDWQRRGYSRTAAYGQSKLANLLFTYELQRRLAAAAAASATSAGDGAAETVALAAHPGYSRTELMRNSPLVFRALTTAVDPLVAQGAAMGALPTLRAATDPAVRGGEYFGPRGPFESRGYPRVVRSNRRSHDEDAQRRLWEVSQELTSVTYPV
jgi:NAD(P)-dependent dehydrogenase (short-subunit alcohol dehydrogenase family)